MNNKNEEFLKDLRSLLKKHNVSIYFDFGEGSDTHGMYNECIVISNDETDEELIRVEGYGMDASDIIRY